MQAKEHAPYLAQKITRRKFVSAFTLLSLFSATYEGTRLSTRNVFETVSLSDFMKGFSLIDQEEFDSLMCSIEPKQLEISDGHFNVVDESANVFIKFTGIPDPSVSLSIFEATIDEDEDKIPLILDPKKYIIPLIESEELYDTTLYLGNLDSGEHSLKLYPTKYTKEIPQQVITEAYSLSSSNLVMQKMLDIIPMLSPKNNVYKYQHIPNDLPLYTYANIRKNDQNGMYLVTYSFIASSEDGGSSPQKLLNGEGRTPDVEWIFMQKIGDDGRRHEAIYQSRHHNASKLSSSHPSNFHVDTGNNMVSRVLHGNKIISILPEFIPGHLWGNDIISQKKALQVLSYRELLYERRMRLDDFSIQQFIQEHLDGINLLTFNLPWPPPIG